MCGIAGFVGRGDRRDLQDMTRTLVHRGPDDEGFYVDDDLRVFLGHRRLAVLDLAFGHQPMWNEDETVAVVFNGEIYNQADLRAELTAAGHVFRSDHSDTEVLVHGYEAWGRELPLRLNGMFAFVVFDRRRRTLFLARDRFGEKPLVYARQPGLFAFASEISALRRHRELRFDTDPRGLRKYFAHGFFPDAWTSWQDVRKLPPGSAACYDLDSAEVHCWRYWRFTVDTDDGMAARPEGELAEELRALLFQSVRARMVSDVPLGVFLSGGIDSSAVVAAARRVRPDISTFTVGFDEPTFDESPFAAAVAAAFGTRHHAERLGLERARDLVPEVLGRLDEPLADASLLPTWMLCAFTRRHVTVALSGDGGDELFAGYAPFRALAPARFYRRLVAPPLHRMVKGAAARMPRSETYMSLDFRLRRALAGLDFPPGLWNPVWLAPLTPSEMVEMFADAESPEELYEEALTLWHRDESLNAVDRSVEFYANFYLPDSVLAKVDRASMMVSLESRAPFLDNDLVAFARRLPHGLKFRRGRGKHLLKRALAGILPDAILNRRKQGFGVPVATWLRRVPEEPPLRPVDGIDLAAVAKRWREHRAGRADHRLFLWAWLSLQYADGRRAA